MTTLVVITDAGNVYGSNVDLEAHTLSPVYELGPGKIGYNYPQDRFMMYGSGVLTDDTGTGPGPTLLVTNNGNVYGAAIDVFRAIGQPEYLNTSRIGYNPQDRFMVANGSAMFVITDTGNVYWTSAMAQAPNPPAYLPGAKIGYNPQDWAMLAIDGTLAVITRPASAGGSNVYACNIEYGPGGGRKS
jgi:hypothetical protein